MAETYEGKPCRQGHTTKYVSNGLCVECSKVRMKDFNSRPENKLLAKLRNVERLYGVTTEEFYAVWDAQGRSCAICKQDILMDDPRVDHNHATGEPRGLLCDTCNTGLGLFRDSEANLRAAADYLREYS